MAIPNTSSLDLNNGPRLPLSEEIPPELHKQFHPKEINVYVLVRAGRDLTWTFSMKRPGFYVSTKGVWEQKGIRIADKTNDAIKDSTPNEIEDMTRASFKSSDNNVGQPVRRVQNGELINIQFKSEPTPTGPSSEYVYPPKLPEWSWARDICMAFTQRIINDDIGRECFIATGATVTAVEKTDRSYVCHQQAFEVRLVNAGDCAQHQLMRTI